LLRLQAAKVTSW